MYLSEGRKVGVIVTTTFWQNAAASQQLIAVGAGSGWRIVHLSHWDKMISIWATFKMTLSHAIPTISE